MAVMGIRINDGGGGADTSVANVFAKALFGDPDREMKYARLQSDLATDEYQRAQIKANEDRIRAAQALDVQKYQGNEAGARAGTTLLHDYYDSTRQAGPAPTEAPAPVELGPDPYAPIPADRPGDQIISAFPARPGAVSDNSYPVPVEPDLVDQIVSGGFPGRPDVGPGAPVGPFPGRPQPQLNEVLTQSPAGVPFPGRPGLPASNRTEDATVISSILRDLRQRDMEEGLRPAYDEPPAPVLALDQSPQPDVPADLSPYYPTQAGFTGDVPVPVDLEAMTPPVAATPAQQPGLRSVDGPLNVLPGNPQDATMAPDMPVPVEPMAVPGAGEFTDPNAGRPARPEETAAVKNAVESAVGPVAADPALWEDFGKAAFATSDPAGFLQKVMGMSGLTYGDPNNAAKLRQSMALIGHAPNTTMVAGPTDDIGTGAAADQAIAIENANPDLKKRISSTGGVDNQINVASDGTITETPIIGATPKPAEVKEFNKIPYQVTTDAQGNAHLQIPDGYTAPDAPAFDTTTYDGVLLNKIVEYNKKKRNGLTTSPDEDFEYSAAFKEKFRPKMSEVRLPNGQLDTQTQFFDPPSDFLVPPGFNTGEVASSTASPSLVPPTPTDPATITAAPAPETATAEAAAAANPLATTGKPLTVRVIAGENAGKDMPIKNNGGWTGPGEKPPSKTNVVEGPAGKVVHTISGDKKEGDVTDSASKAHGLLIEAIPAAAKLNEYGPGKKPVPSNFQSTMANWQRDYVSGDLIDGIVDQDTREYLRSILAFVNMPKRVESGAAVNLQEVRDYIAKYTMAPGSTNVREYLSAKAARTQQLRAERLKLNSELRSGDLQAIDAELQKYGQDIDWTPPSDAELNAEREQIKKTRRPDPSTGSLGEAQ